MRASTRKSWKNGARRAGCCRATPSSGREFSDLDLARAHFIRDLQNLGVNYEGIPIVLDLVDQVHGLRRVARDLLDTVKALQQQRGAK